MAADAQLIIRQAQEALQDLPGVRYPASELVRFLNAAQVLIVISRPEQAAGFAEAVLFIAILLAGLFYLIRIGALDWAPAQRHRRAELARIRLAKQSSAE